MTTTSISHMEYTFSRKLTLFNALDNCDFISKSLVYFLDFFFKELLDLNFVGSNRKYSGLSLECYW